MHRLGVIAIAFAALVVALLAALTWTSTQQATRAADAVRHTHEVIGVLARAEAALYHAEAGQRGYLLTGRPDFLADRDAAIAELQAHLARAQALTAGTPTVRPQVAALGEAVVRRIEIYRRNQQVVDSGATPARDLRLDDAQRAMATLHAGFAAWSSEERRLLAAREAHEAQQVRARSMTFVALVAVMALLLPLLAWRVRSDLVARRHAEQEAVIERAYDSAHARALILYNAKTDRQQALDGTLALLAENRLFPASVFYAHEEWGGVLRLVAAHGAPADAKPLLRVGEGVIGSSARHREAVYLGGFDSAVGLVIETGLATLRPAGLLMSPVWHQERLLGVLVLACAAPLRERDGQFVDRLCAQLGVALDNLGQLESLELLAEQLRASGEDIRQKNEQLERANRMKSEFVANMSHELRTPLNAVIGFSEILHDGLAGELNAEQREYVGDIHDSGKHLLALINDILDLSKVEAGQMELELTPVAPAELAASGVAVVREKAAERGVRLAELCAPGLGRVQLDSRKSKQIVFNLMANAIKFTPNGGRVALSIQRVPSQRLDEQREAADVRLFLPAERETAHWLEISVSDTGIGISPASLRELFQPFVQIDSSLGRKYGGTGLGLTMVRRLTDLHGGGLMARSTPEQGSTFTVWLPWREQALADTTAALDVADIDGAEMALEAVRSGVAPPSIGPLVLLIEDDPRTASLMRAQLLAQGFQVEVARDAERGLEAAARLKPRAIVLDIILPDIDGWDVLAKLKEHDATRHVPVVIASITDEARRGFALGAAQVLMKPVSQEDLVAALAAVGLGGATDGGRVLVVDDDPKAVTLVRKHLQMAGFETVAAHGGREALELMRMQPCDAIVLDLMMPQVSGFDVVEALAADPALSCAPVIVLTSKLISAEDRAALRGRVQRILEKSDFQAAGLVAEVRRALSRRAIH